MTDWEATDILAPDLVPFLRAAADGQLVIPRCASCGHFQFPPRPTCRFCRSTEFMWPNVSFTGRLYSWTITHRAPLPALVGKVPYVVVIVTLDLPDLVRLLGQLAEYQPTRELVAGQRLAGRFDLAADSASTVLPLLRWSPVDEETPQ